MTTEAQKKAKSKYDKATARPLYLKLNANTDADILQKLNEVENKQGYVKALIRADISREQS